MFKILNISSLILSCTVPNPLFVNIGALPPTEGITLITFLALSTPKIFHLLPPNTISCCGIKGELIGNEPNVLLPATILNSSGV